MDALDQKHWWTYIGSDLQKLFETSQYLIDTVGKLESNLALDKDTFDDYSFVVFPAAKAYEGFLKKIFLDLGFISQEDYFGKHFRIGKSLNPSLPKELRREEVYSKIVNYCGGKKLANDLWETWRVSRNLVFHWFPNEKNAITFEEAVIRVNMIINAIDSAFEECKIKVRESEKSVNLS